MNILSITNSILKFCVCFALVLPMVTGCSHNAKKFTAEQLNLAVNGNKLSLIFLDIKTSLATISYLKMSEEKRALELHEHRLDVAVCELWENKHKFTSSQNKEVSEIISLIKNYRKDNPRKQEASIASGDIYLGWGKYEDCANSILSAVNDDDL